MRHLLTVADVMTTDVVSVAEDTPFKAVAAILAEHHISAVPVRNVYGGVAGVVSETDLLRKEEYQRSGKRWFHRKARIKADALTAGALMTRPAITVEGGCTLDEAARLMAAHRITRPFAKRSTVAFAETLIAGVDGVVGVRNELTWAFDDTAPAAGTAGPFY